MWHSLTGVIFFDVLFHTLYALVFCYLPQGMLLPFIHLRCWCKCVTGYNANKTEPLYHFRMVRHRTMFDASCIMHHSINRQISFLSFFQSVPVKLTVQSISFKCIGQFLFFREDMNEWWATGPALLWRCGCLWFFWNFYEHWTRSRGKLTSALKWPTPAFTIDVFTLH